MKRTPLRRKPMRKQARGVIEQIASEAWAKHARSKPCAVCDRRRGLLIRGHHVIYKQRLAKLAGDLADNRAEMLEILSRLRWDHRNCLPLCDACHERHHSGSRPVSRAVVARGAPKVFQFAAEIDRRFSDGRAPATRFIEETYP